MTVPHGAITRWRVRADAWHRRSDAPERGALDRQPDQRRRSRAGRRHGGRHERGRARSWRRLGGGRSCSTTLSAAGGMSSEGWRPGWRPARSEPGPAAARAPRSGGSCPGGRRAARRPRGRARRRGGRRDAARRACTSRCPPARAPSGAAGCAPRPGPPPAPSRPSEARGRGGLGARAPTSASAITVASAGASWSAGEEGGERGPRASAGSTGPAGARGAGRSASCSTARQHTPPSSLKVKYLKGARLRRKWRRRGRLRQGRPGRHPVGRGPPERRLDPHRGGGREPGAVRRGAHSRRHRLRLEEGPAGPGQARLPGPGGLRQALRRRGGLERPHRGALRRPQQLVRRVHLLVPEVLRPQQREAGERPA